MPITIKELFELTYYMVNNSIERCHDYDNKYYLYTIPRYTTDGSGLLERRDGVKLISHTHTMINTMRHSVSSKRNE
jgi:hypothetical protein